jgi:hypothetical protein
MFEFDQYNITCATLFLDEKEATGYFTMPVV